MSEFSQQEHELLTREDTGAVPSKNLLEKLFARWWENTKEERVLNTQRASQSRGLVRRIIL